MCDLLMIIIQECDGWSCGYNVPTVNVFMDTVHAVFMASDGGVLIISRSSGSAIVVSVVV